MNGTPPDELDSSPDQNITLTFEGINYTNTTNASGIATFTIPAAGNGLQGDYPYTATYNKTTLYEGIDKTSKITVNDSASNLGPVPGTGRNPITGPITDIPTSYPPAPPYVPTTTGNNKPTINNNPTTTITKSNIKTTFIGKSTSSKKGVKIETKAKKAEKTTKLITYCENRKINGTLKPFKVIINQTYKNGKESGKPTLVSREKANKSIYFENFDLTKKEKNQYKNYLKKTSNCQVNNPAIQKQVINILSKVPGKLTPEKKAKAFQNFIKNRRQYEYYPNTKYGAINGLKRLLKKGPGVDALNCADQSHLMIAMLRTSGVPAVYEHGKKGEIGHYWPRALVSKDTWVKLDSTSIRNGYDYTTWSVKKYPVVRQLYSLGNNANQCKKIPDNNVINALNKKKYK